MLRLKAPKSVAIETDIPEGLTVHADPLHLGNMLTNLIDNAIKYSRDSVQITVRADARCITVADNGIGISKSDRTRIFDRFYRVSMPGRNDVAGYGLGLYYVRRIAELHGWTIDVTANKPEGSVFTIIIDKR